MSGDIPKGHPPHIPIGGTGGSHPGGANPDDPSGGGGGGHPAHIPKGGGGHPGGSLPGSLSGEKVWTPRLIAWELTRSCNLDCVHCRAAARFGPYPNELTTEESFTLLDDVASF